MPPTLSAGNNTGYSPDLINTKYSPLRDIVIAAGDKSLYQAIFTARVTALSQPNVFPRMLSLVTSGLPAPIMPNSPPMVVISSNRAEWMKTLFENADAKNRDLAFTGFNDVTTFSRGLVPWYSPLRAQKVLYIVVHQNEYAHYKKLLAQYAQVYIVGWSFPTVGRLSPVGFGASRFAALEFVKSLGYLRAWTVDDNVVNINGFPNAPKTIEDFMTDTIAGIGFTAATGNIATLDEVKKKATFEDKTPVFATQKPGLLQQVVLWNLDYLSRNNATISPYFVSSNEDVSLTNCIQVKNLTRTVIKPLSVIKAQPANDTQNRGAVQLAGLRTQLLTVLYNLERVRQISKDGARPVNLGDFVSDVILPNSAYRGVVMSAGKRKALERTTQSMAIEQALADAVLNNWAPPEIFNPFRTLADPKVERRLG